MCVLQTLQKEMEGHQPRVDEVQERGRRMAAAAEAEGRPEAQQIRESARELEGAWAHLQDEMDQRQQRLEGSHEAQQYLNDADEAEAWIGEQELYMIADEKAKVRGRLEDQEGSLGVSKTVSHCLTPKVCSVDYWWWCGGAFPVSR